MNCTIVPVKMSSSFTLNVTGVSRLKHPKRGTYFQSYILDT